MKIDGEVRWERAAAAAAIAAQTGSSQALSDSFKAALQRCRRPATSSREEWRPRPADRERVRVVTRLPERPSQASASQETEAPELTPSALTAIETRMRPIHSAGSGSVHNAVVTAESHEPSRSRRTGGGNGPGSCIEVVHARTGTRFVLSRDGDAWLLAIESETTPSPAELASVISMLNARFAARGLGPIDVLMG
jgi:hypothetical protein